MAGRSIWSNSPWDPTGGRARRGRTKLRAGDKILFGLVGLAIVAAAAAAVLLTS